MQCQICDSKTGSSLPEISGKQRGENDAGDAEACELGRFRGTFFRLRFRLHTKNDLELIRFLLRIICEIGRPVFKDHDEPECGGEEEHDPENVAE